MVDAAGMPAWMRLKEPATRLILQCHAPGRLAAGAAWGVILPEEPCRARLQGGRAALWLGPEEHLLWQASRDPSSPFDELERALAPFPHSLVDVSHRQVALEIIGPHASTILSGACPLDLDSGEFPVHMCTRTVLAKAEIVLWRLAPDAFHLEVGRSFQSYAVELLREIARDYSAAP